MLKWFLIAAGGAVGSIARYALQGLVQRATSSGFPLGTLVVNLTGCLAIGFLMATFTGPKLIREEYRIGIIVGILGGYTTFSTFGWETFSHINDREFSFAALNLILSCSLGILAVWAGYRLSELVYGV